jgi:hypothetical protein
LGRSGADFSYAWDGAIHGPARIDLDPTDSELFKYPLICMISLISKP